MKLHRILFSGCWICLLLVGCSEQFVPDNPSDANSVPVNAALSISFNMEGEDGVQTRAAGGDEFATEGERNISSLTVMLVDVNNGTEDFSKRDYITVPGSLISNNTLKVEMETSSGPKHVYIGANLSPRQIENFYNTEGIDALAGNYEEAMSRVLTFQAPAAEGLYAPATDICMIGQAETNDASATTEIPFPPQTGTGTTTNIALKATLRRVVAKVLLTCTTRTRNDGTQDSKYAVVDDTNSGSPDYPGWIDLNDIWFVLTNANRKYYMRQRITGGKVIDPNYPLGDYLIRNTYGSYAPNAIHPENFISYGSSELTIPQQGGSIPFSTSTKRMRALEYDVARMPKGSSSNKYTEGLYCLENTIKNDLNDLSSSEKLTVPAMASTRLIVAARYMPKYIHHKMDGIDDVQPKEYDYTDAESLLKARTGTDQDDNTVNYPDGTFFWYNYKNDLAGYYTYEAMQWMITNGKATRKSFIDYVGGWGFYETYITGKNENGQIQFVKEFGEEGGIERNQYYLLNVSKFSTPGQTNVTRKGEILVNSVRTDWKNVGQSNVNIKPQ